MSAKEVMAAHALLQQGIAALANARNETNEIEKSLAAEKPMHN